MNVAKPAAWWRRMARRLGRELFHFADNNCDSRIDHNGERWLLHTVFRAQVASFPGRPLVVLDVGANTGGYSRMVLQAARAWNCPVKLHAFEPSPDCAATLRTSMTDSGVRIVAAAASDRNGEAVLHATEPGSSQGSLMVRPDFAAATTSSVTIPALRLDSYLQSAAVERVDLLKLDTEGSERAALTGMGELLRPDRVGVIQFEYGGTTLDAGVSLRDLYRMLEARGFVIAKLFPASLEVRGYAPWMEHYAFANYVAVSPGLLETWRAL